MSDMSSLYAPFFAFRTPLLPFSAFAQWGEGLGSSEPMDAEGLARWRAGLRTRLRAWVERPEVREALFLASPDLDAALEAWRADPEGAKGIRAETALVRYFARMCGRATPFGLFAGCSLGRIGAATRLELGPREAYARHTRLDMDYLFALTETLGRDAALREGLRFRPNSSLYRAAGRLRYVEARMQGRSRTYHLVAVDETDYLLDTLARAKGGATLHALAEALVAPGLELDETRGYLDQLAESQILVPELAPPVTGPEPIHALIAELERLPAGGSAAGALSEVRDRLSDLDGQGLGAAPAAYRAVAERLEALPVKVELNRLFQVDLVKPAPEAVLGDAVVEAMRQAVDLLHRLEPPPQGGHLKAFREAFERRYEGREVPLLEALDEEGGVGFKVTAAGEVAPLLEGIVLPGRPGPGEIPWSGRDAHMAKALAGLGGRVEWALAEGDLKAMESTMRRPLPASVAVVAKLAAASEADLREGRFDLLCPGASGPSGANLLGRFCHGHPELESAVRDLLKAEEALAPEALHAEVVHLPEGRIGNVILRPLLRGYEIPFLGRSGAPEAQQIPVEDLRVSVREGRIVLRSASLDREVRPRLTNAHNYTNRSLGLYSFLCMLQRQELASALDWSWGPFEDLPFLPRVRWNRCILALARWRTEKAEVAAAVEAQGVDRLARVGQWREARRIPHMALLTEGDHQLPVDFDNPLSVDAFLDAVKARPHFVLEEMAPGLSAAQGPEGAFVHELVVPLLTQVQEKAPTRSRAAHVEPRTFLPGSEWLYAKLYAGAAGCDQLLRDLVGPLVEELKASGLLEGWFFIRYQDPDAHLRLRLKGDGARLLAEAAPRLHARAEPFLREGLLWRLQFDTYEREVERYGPGEAMRLAEQLFQADSEAVLALLEAHEGDDWSDARWRHCLVGMDQLLKDLGLDLEARHRLASSMAAGFSEEHGLKGDFLGPVSERFRKERAALTRSVEGEASAPAFLHRSQRLVSVVEGLRALAGREGVPPLEELAGSYLHMHANRLLRSAHRAQETLLYDFLNRIYASRMAQARKALARG